jgi:hypothetical protein
MRQRLRQQLAIGEAVAQPALDEPIRISVAQKV